MHTLGSKSIASLKFDLEKKYRRKFSRGEMFTISHKKKDGSFVCEEAREKNDQLLAKIEETSFEEEAYEQVFGKEHPGRVRGMGFGVVPSQMRKRYSCSASSSTAGPSQPEYDSLKEELDTLKGKMGELEALKAQMATILQHIGAQQPSHFPFNEDVNLGSPGLRRSSHASHDPHCDGPNSSPHIPSSSPQPQP
ncbi:hypothetical protein QN277_016724 [Acacia crassicarpa]|uniref:Uncharacterized protein n=1 Tax=Acacia crassicarpa TaxID=499986 RepID=A0AAE1MXH9_9FABA|nr:hypothetical protein QN277_016724 [Acacia crassicarpa]